MNKKDVIKFLEEIETSDEAIDRFFEEYRDYRLDKKPLPPGRAILLIFLFIPYLTIHSLKGFVSICPRSI
jgi:hypothetical protein